MEIERRENADEVPTFNVEAANDMLKRSVGIEKIINERKKRVDEFRKLGLSQRRVVTNLVNEMRLRIDFLGTPFDNFK